MVIHVPRHSGCIPDALTTKMEATAIDPRWHVVNSVVSPRLNSRKPRYHMDSSNSPVQPVPYQATNLPHVNFRRHFRCPHDVYSILPHGHRLCMVNRPGGAEECFGPARLTRGPKVPVDSPRHPLPLSSYSLRASLISFAVSTPTLTVKTPTPTSTSTGWKT